MNIKVKDIDKIIEILLKKKEELINEDKESTFIIKQQLITPQESFPVNWYVERNENNYRTINSYANSIFPSKGWEGKSRYLANKIHYPISKHNIPSGYIEITYQDFITNIYQRNLPF